MVKCDKGDKLSLIFKNIQTIEHALGKLNELAGKSEIILN